MANTIDILGDDIAIDSLINKSIVEFIDDNITSIGNYAFYECKSLTSVDFPNATSIGEDAFYYCENLTSVNIPNATRLNGSAFEYCKALRGFDSTNATYIGNSAFRYCFNLAYIDFPNVTNIDNYMCNSCYNLEHINLPKIRYTAEDILSGCKSISMFYAPAVVKVGKGSIFADCFSLEIIDLPRCSTIDTNSYSSSFRYCCALRALILRNNTVCKLNSKFSEKSFIGYGTGYIYVPKELVDSYKSAANWSTYANRIRAIEDYPEICGYMQDSINEQEFKNSSITSAYFPNVANIGNEAFYECYNLTSAYFPNAVNVNDGAFYNNHNLQHAHFTGATTIGDSVFYNCSNLKRIVMPKVVSVGKYAFEHCNNIESVYMQSVASIDEAAFKFCSKLKSAIFFNLNTINNYSFSDCVELTTIIIDNKSSVCEAYESIFRNTPIESGTGYIYVPKELVDSYKSATNWSTYANQIRAIEDYPEIQNIYCRHIETNEFKNSTIESVYFPNVLTIGDYAFYGCGQLTSADFPNVININEQGFYGAKLTSINFPNLKAVGKQSFSGVPLTNVNLPDVTYIGESAFSNCHNLTSVNIPNVIRIGIRAFNECNSLTSVNIPNATNIGKYAFSGCSNLTSIDIPNVTTISNRAFYNCGNLTSVNIPNATNIGEGAFSGCDNLTSVNIPNATSIDGSAFYHCDNLTSIDFPNATSIGEDAFCYCENLTSVNLLNSESVCELGSGVFSNTGIDGVNGFIYVPFELLNDYKTHPTWAQYNHAIAPVGNGVYIKDVEDIYLLYNTSKLTSVMCFYNLENQDNLEPTITVTSTNENIATVTNVLFDNNHISFNVNSLSTTGDTDIVITATIGEYTHSTTFKIRVSETAPIATYEVESVEDSVYGFEMNNNGYYESKNKGVKSSYAICKLLLYTEGGNNIYLDCINSGESNYDYGIISNINTTLTLSSDADSNVLKSFKGFSSLNIQTVDLGVLPQGEYFVYIKYIKDGSSDSGNDTLQFKIRIESVFE